MGFEGTATTSLLPPIFVSVGSLTEEAIRHDILHTNSSPGENMHVVFVDYWIGLIELFSSSGCKLIVVWYFHLPASSIGCHHPRIESFALKPAA